MPQRPATIEAQLHRWEVRLQLHRWSILGPFWGWFLWCFADQHCDVQISESFGAELLWCITGSMHRAWFSLQRTQNQLSLVILMSTHCACSQRVCSEIISVQSREPFWSTAANCKLLGGVDFYGLKLILNGSTCSHMGTRYNKVSMDVNQPWPWHTIPPISEWFWILWKKQLLRRWLHG